VRNVWTIARREFAAYFVSPIAYAVAVIFFLILGLFFNYVDLPQQAYYATVADVFSRVTTISLFIAPALTMRLIAEERRSRTLELLLTAPIRDSELILGKFLAGLGFYLVLVALASIYPLILFAFGNPDPRLLITGYIGVVLFGAALIALGTLASTLSQNQILAFFAGFGMVLALMLVGAPARVAGPQMGEVLRALAINSHLADFQMGILDTRHVVYFLSLTVAALFLATRVLEGRRWSG
jgi:ABC-2 type transport system permease protein